MTRKQIVLNLNQSLETAAPTDDEALESAILTIKDPEPYVEEEAFDMEFHFEVKSADVTVVDGRLVASRELVFTLNIQDEAATRTWLLQGGLLRQHEELSDADWPIAISHLMGDYEGSFVGDDMVQFETSVALAD